MHVLSKIAKQDITLFGNLIELLNKYYQPGF